MRPGSRQDWNKRRVSGRNYLVNDELKIRAWNEFPKSLHARSTVITTKCAAAPIKTRANPISEYPQKNQALIFMVFSDVCEPPQGVGGSDSNLLPTFISSGLPSAILDSGSPGNLELLEGFLRDVQLARLLSGGVAQW